MRPLQLADPERPVYRQIADEIRAQIEAGELATGARLPAIRTLSGELGVNRDTVALAYDSLASLGLVEATVGRGTFVRAPGAPERVDAVDLAYSPQVESLLALANARPRFGTGGDTVALHSLIPDPAFYPIEAFRRAFNRVVAEQGAELFLYGTPEGHTGLREVLAERFEREGMRVGASNIVLCHGASQGIALAVRLFAQPGDAVAVEAPTYQNVLGTLAGLGVRPVPVPTDAAGPDLAALERVLSRPDVKALYTIPTFHNPLGTTTSLAHRRALLDVAARCRVAVIEDAFEMDLRFTGRSVPSLAALDDRGVVVHLFSFSKSLFPGVRVGSITASGRAVEALVVLKQATDLSDSLPLQGALAEFIASGAYDRHLARLRRVLRSRRDALVEALADAMPEGTTWTEPEGGYQVWVELPIDVDTRDLLADAARAGVQFAPGSQFWPDGGPSRGLRLTLAQADERQIRAGVEALARVVRERSEAESGARPASRVHL